MSFFENIQGVFETQFGTLPRPEGGGSTGGAGDWNTLANRPFGYVEHYDLLPETTVQFSGGNPAIGGLALTSPLTEGKAYPVNFDGTQYLCKYESGKLGNLALEDGPDTGEPFLWYVTESMILTTAGAGTHTVSLQGDVPQKVPEEYLNPPDWNKMVNRPFGLQQDYIIPEQQLAFEMAGENVYMAMVPVNCDMMMGEQYVLTVDGVSHQFQYDKWFANGNLSIFGEMMGFQLEDTGEPFALAFGSGAVVVMMRTGGTVSLSLCGPMLKSTTVPYQQVPALDLVELGAPKISTAGEMSVEIPNGDVIFGNALKNGFIELTINCDFSVLTDFNIICKVPVCFSQDNFTMSYTLCPANDLTDCYILNAIYRYGMEGTGTFCARLIKVPS